MDKRVEIIKPNYFYVDCNKFLDRTIYTNRTNVQVYRYVFDHYKLLNFEPTFEKGKNEVTFTVLYECNDTHCQHCYKAIKKKVHIPGQANLGTNDATIDTVEITLLR